MRKIDSLQVCGFTLYTVEAVAKKFCYHPVSLIRLINQGKLKPYGRVGRSYILALEECYRVLIPKK